MRRLLLDLNVVLDVRLDRPPHGAAASRCEAIVSRDSAGFRDSPAPVIDPETARAWLAAR